MRITERNPKRGFALVVVLGLLFVVLALGTAMITMSLSEKRAAESQKENVVARNMAEAGMEYALRQLNADPTWRCENAPAAFTNAPLRESIDGKATTLGTFTVDPIVSLADGSLQVTAHGFYPSDAPGAATKAVRAIVSSTTSSHYQYAMLARSSMTISGKISPNTDSYDSTLGPYNALTAGRQASVRVESTNPTAFAISGASGVGGDVIFAPGTNLGSVGISHSYIMDGDSDPSNDFQAAATAADLTSVTVPSNARPISDINNNSMIVSNVKIPSGIWYCDGINIQTGQQVRISGSVTLYVRGNVTIGGYGIANNNDDLGAVSHAGDLQILGTKDCTTVSISGNSKLTAAIYAPDAAISKTKAVTQFYGALVGNSILLSGGGSVHYDTSLQRVGGSQSTGLAVKAWAQM